MTSNYEATRKRAAFDKNDEANNCLLMVMVTLLRRFTDGNCFRNQFCIRTQIIVGNVFLFLIQLVYWCIVCD